jgi:mannonate dehydratase
LPKDPANALMKMIRRTLSSRIGWTHAALLKAICNFETGGMRWVRLEFGTEPTPFETLRATQQRFARYGIRIFSGVHYTYRSLKVQLGQPDRDQDIETYRNFIRDLGKLDIPVASYDFHPANTYTTNQVERRGYLTREFSTDDFRKKVEKQQFEREYSAEEIWTHYTYFFKAVLPVAEEAGVKLALHPDDPPLAKMNGVAKLFTHYDGYRRAEQIAGNSRNWGLTFCVGTWSEGGNAMGKDVFEMIRDFGGRGKIFEVHFRNVSSPLPHFVETFPDDGYMDMYQVRTLRQVRAAARWNGPYQLGGQVWRAGSCASTCRAARRAHEGGSV